MSDIERTMEAKSMSNMKKCFISCQALLSMLLVQVFAAGMQLLSRAILVQGTFIFALIAYRHFLAAICVAPLALYFEKGRTKNFNWKVWFWLFINALVGMTMAQGLFYYGLRDTSATFSANFLNMVPVSTFITSVTCRMEKLGLETWSGKAKSLGAILCVVGAIAISVCKGKEFYIGHLSHHTQTNVAVHETHMFRGTIILVCSCFFYTAWYLAQVKLLKVFPLAYWGTMIACAMTAVQAAIIGVFIDSRKAAWRLKWDLQLITIVYSGVLCTAVKFCLLTWTIKLKGPTYPSMFNPLGLIFAAISGAVVLGEPISVGLMWGMVVIVIGLYSFLWGKKNEAEQLVEPNVASVEISTSINDEPSRAQSTAVQVPSSLPAKCEDPEN